MRTDWRWLGWVLWGGLVACGATSQEPPATEPESPAREIPTPDTPVPTEPPASTPPTGETPSGTPDTPSQEPSVPRVQPSPSPGDVPPVKAGLEGAPTLSPVACVPWTGRVPPQRATACEGTSVFADGHREVGRYDKDSRLLELHVYAADGTATRHERHTWENGRETFRRVEQPRDGLWSQSVWLYDAQGHLRERTDTSSWEDATVYRYLRDANGRLERIDRLPEGERNTPIVYQYDARGRLERIDSRPNCDMNLARCETFTYWPNGQPREDHWDNDDVSSITHQYDARGQLVDEREGGFESLRHTVRSFDSGGRVFRLWESKGVYVYEHELLDTFFYDASGLLLLERFGKDYTQPSGNSIDDPLVTRFVRTTRRLTYLCGTRIVWLDEWDGDEDGVVDARRTHERDAQGRLVHEQYTGTPGLDSGPVRRDFKYTCD
jgi:hypothetical protein